MEKTTPSACEDRAYSGFHHEWQHEVPNMWKILSQHKSPSPCLSPFVITIRQNKAGVISGEPFLKWMCKASHHEKYSLPPPKKVECLKSWTILTNSSEFERTPADKLEMYFSFMCEADQETPWLLTQSIPQTLSPASRRSPEGPDTASGEAEWQQTKHTILSPLCCMHRGSQRVSSLQDACLSFFHFSQVQKCKKWRIAVWKKICLT